MGKLTNWIPLWIKEPLCILLKESKTHPFSIACSHAVCDYANIRNLPETKRRQIYRTFHQRVSDYLSTRYGHLVDAGAADMGTPVPNAPIWVFWWQGLNNAPELVKICVASLQRNRGNHPVIIVDQWNYSHYVRLPEYIPNKLREGVISLTHFSDILRVNLLAAHGGLWCDATIYCTRQIPEEVFSTPFFTCRNPGGNYENISNWNWTGYLMGSWTGNVFFKTASAVFNAYWENENQLLDYFLIDYVLNLVLEGNQAVHSMIYSVPPNNVNQTYLQEHFSAPLTPEHLTQLEQGDTWLFKTSWKTTYPRNVLGKETLYGYWLRTNREKMS